MKHLKKTAILILFLVIITGCGKNKYMKEISYKEYKELLENKETFILEVMRTDCSACISFKPNITAVANEYKIEIKYINTDHLSDKEKEELFDNNGITGTPTVLFYNNGEEDSVASRLVGSVSKDKIISKFKANDFIK